MEREHQGSAQREACEQTEQEPIRLKRNARNPHRRLRQILLEHHSSPALAPAALRWLDLP